MNEDLPPISEKEMRKLMSKALIKHTDMPQEMATETLEVITMAVDKFLNNKNYEAASLLIKNTLDKKFGLTWHCAVGEGFGFDVTCQNRYLIYVFYGNVGVVCYKC
ncbi:hypothetical protein TrCOL_g11281 [Triparma columacea]|uniref:Dynein light chain n=1 Tax=Triparma columacea TaxID=722753 RepID=A0A9W7L365_9STRA|nr:hypothetical protein TrCOL_g11281 [Triparma columacea]